MRKLLFLLAFFALLLPTKVYAGGGPVALFAFPLRPFDQTKTFILQAEVYTDQPCNQVKPNFTFNDSVDGDSITAFTPPDDGTYITHHYFITNYPTITWKEICTTYVQAKSGVAKQRTAVVAIDVNGQTETRETFVSFGDDAISKQLQSFGRVNDYDNIPQPDVLSEKFLGGPKREVNLHWQKIPWATKYAVFAREINQTGNITEPSFPLATTESTQATINLAAFSDFYINAIACKADDPCINKQDGYSFLLPRMHISTPNGGLPPEEVKIIPLAPPPPQEIPADAVHMTSQSPTQDTQVEELNKKVASLEAKLANSEEKQSALQQRLNDLISFIKNLFPFFK